MVAGHCLHAGIIESHNFFVLGRILVKFHIRTWLIESFPMTFRTCWCAKEKLHFTPVHTLLQGKRHEELFPPLRKFVEFRVRYRQIPVRGFFLGGGPKPGCSDSARAGIVKSHNFFVVSPILVKFHIRTWLIESFPITYSLGRCAKEKLHFTAVHTLRQLKRDEALIPPLRRS